MKITWNEYNKVMHVIEKYYPVGCDYDDFEYQNSKQHKRLEHVLCSTGLFEREQKVYNDVLKQVFPNNYVKHYTDNTYPCYQFSVLLHENQPIMDDDVKLMRKLNGRRFDLVVYVSRISDFYYIYTNETLYDGTEWRFRTHSPAYRLDKGYLYKLQKMFAYMGKRRLDAEFAHMEVPFLRTELLPRENYKVTVFNCLFSDMEVDFY